MTRVCRTCCRRNTLFKEKRLVRLIGHPRRGMSSIMMMVNMYVGMRMGLNRLGCRRWRRVSLDLGPMNRLRPLVMIIKQSVA